MRIAIVSQLSSPGGGARFLRGLCLGLLEQREVAEIGLFIASADAARDGLVSLLPDSPRLRVHLMTGDGRLLEEADAARPAQRPTSLREWARGQRGLVRAYRWLRRLDSDTPAQTGSDAKMAAPAEAPPLPRITLSERVEAAIAAYDVAYFPWPRQVVPPAHPAALVATFHDFNHRHGFGNYREQDVELLDAEMVEWLSGRVQPICSTPFIAGELESYYPERTNAPAIVYLSTFAVHDPDVQDVTAVMTEFGLPEGYVLCPTNIGPHKNLITLLRAAGMMKRAGTPLHLVLTGSGTQCLGTDPTGDPLYSFVFVEPIDRLNAALEEEGLVPGEDVWPLGYVTDEQMDALVKGAALVAAPSRYEAGSGPALDAWWLGTGVASSSIEPVLQQMAFLGTEALLFDPTDVTGLAEVLTTALDEPTMIREMVERSKRAIARYTWNDVAREYVTVFARTIESAGRSEALREQIATRLADRVVMDPDALLAWCSRDPGFMADLEAAQTPRRNIKTTILHIPLLGPAIRAALRLVRSRGGRNVA